jgi:membrane-bound serine protease (ClpP class)
MMRYARALLIIILFLLIAAVGIANVAASQPHVDVLTVEGSVNPVLADYIDRGIGQAEQDGAVACIIMLDTPGGLLSSTQEITDRIQNAKVPVVVYVNRWAGSAGTFITLSADVAAMAKGSRIGAAHPVSAGGEETSETMDMKVTEDAAAAVRSFAHDHGRNEVAAAATVRKALSFTDQEALGKTPLTPEYQQALILDDPYLDPPLVDVGAKNLDELIAKLGEGITLANGKPFSIPSDATPNYIGMSTMEDFLYAISDPNIAYILMSIAMLGILIELSHPGLIVPGLVGGICLLLSIYSLGMLEANWAGILLVVLAFGLFIAEIFTSSFGLLTAGGVASLVLGSLILFRGSPFEIDPRVIAGVAVFFTALFAFVIGAIIRSYRRQVTTGREGLVGQVAVARTALDPQGTVFMKGERWTATTESDRIEAGEEVMVTKVDRLKLRVIKKSK